LVLIPPKRLAVTNVSRPRLRFAEHQGCQLLGRIFLGERPACPREFDSSYSYQS
jgi:hypothetical protein